MFNIPISGQTEPAYKVNYIFSGSFGGVSNILILGVLFLLAAGLIFVFRKKIAGSFSRNFFALVFLFWLPFFGIFLFNNFNDLVNDFEVYGRYDLVGKQIIHLCLIDGDTGVYCGLTSFMKTAGQLVPPNSRVAIITDPSIEPYLAYQAVPAFFLEKKAAAADYILLYYPQQYFFSGDSLYRNTAEGQEEIGRYSLLGSTGPGKLILKTIR
jgi:hypothetical protein